MPGDVGIIIFQMVVLVFLCLFRAFHSFSDLKMAFSSIDSCQVFMSNLSFVTTNAVSTGKTQS